MTQDLPLPILTLLGLESRREPGLICPEGGGLISLQNCPRKRMSRCHPTSKGGMMLDSGWPHSLKRWVPGSSGKGHVLPGGSGYAKRSTKMALAVVWPKMKAPRVTKRTP